MVHAGERALLRYGCDHRGERRAIRRIARHDAHRLGAELPQRRRRVPRRPARPCRGATSAEDAAPRAPPPGADTAAGRARPALRSPGRCPPCQAPAAAAGPASRHGGPAPCAGTQTAPAEGRRPPREAATGAPPPAAPRARPASPGSARVPPPSGRRRGTRPLDAACRQPRRHGCPSCPSRGTVPREEAGAATHRRTGRRAN